MASWGTQMTNPGMATGKGLCREGQALPAWLYSGGVRMVPETVEKFLDLGEEPGGFGVGVAGRLPLELGEKLLLALVEFLRRFHHHLDVHVAGAARAEHRHALALEAEHAAGLGAFRHLHAGLAAVDQRDVEAAAERRRHHRDRDATVQIGAVALEDRMLGERDENVEVAGRTAARAGFAFTREPDARAILDPCRDVHRERALARDAAGARAGRTRILDHLAPAVTRRTRALHGEEALGMADLAVAAASRARLRT